MGVHDYTTAMIGFVDVRNRQNLWMSRIVSTIRKNTDLVLEEEYADKMPILC